MAALTPFPVPELGEVHVWTIDLKTIPDELELLDADERGRAEGFRVAGARRRFERRRVALRRLLACYLGCEPGAVQIDRACPRCGDPGHGKPRLRGGSAPTFSTAASGDLAVVAVAVGTELGIDVEDPERIAAAFEQGTPSGFLSRGERQAAEAEGHEALWVRKEALSKAIGTGLVAGAHELDTAAPADPWRLYDLPRIDGRRAALAADAPLHGLRRLTYGRD